MRKLIKRKKIVKKSFLQRFKKASFIGKVFIILKCIFLMKRKQIKKPFSQRFKEASTSHKIFMILKCVVLFFLSTSNEVRRIAHKTELGNYISYYEDTGEIICVCRPEHNIFKHANH